MRGEASESDPIGCQKGQNTLFRAEFTLTRLPSTRRLMMYPVRRSSKRYSTIAGRGEPLTLCFSTYLCCSWLHRIKKLLLLRRLLSGQTYRMALPEKPSAAPFGARNHWWKLAPVCDAKMGSLWSMAS